MEVTYTLTHKELMRRFAPPMPLRERLPLLLAIASPLFVYAVAYINGIQQAIVLDLVVGLYRIASLLMITLWVLKAYIGRTNKSTSYFVEISDDEFFLKAANSTEHCYSWTHFGNIADWGDYVMFTSAKGQHIAVVPKSAFDDENHAQTFFVQSRRYWEIAKQKQQEEIQKAEGSWPPAPRPGA